MTNYLDKIKILCNISSKPEQRDSGYKNMLITLLKTENQLIINNILTLYLKTF